MVIMYATVEDLQRYLWMKFDWDTTSLIQTIIDWVENAINTFIWVDSILASDYVEKIDKRSIILTPNWYNIYLKNKPVNEIKTINWKDFTGELWKDYMIIRDRQLILKNMEFMPNFDFLEIWYNSWHKEVPSDIRTVVVFLTATLRITRNYTWMTNYRLWDESISIWTQRFMYGSPMVSDILRKYKKLYLAY